MAATTQNPREMLTADHLRMDELFARFLTTLDEDDTSDARAVWAQLEDALLTHLDAEEMFVFPAFQGVDPVECASLLAEHAILRAQLGEIGIHLDLHMVRRDRVVELGRTLQAHATREEALAYRWAEQHLNESRVAALVSRLRQGWVRRAHRDIVREHDASAHPR